jgi:iron complex outermembrane receptor protein
MLSRSLAAVLVGTSSALALSLLVSFTATQVALAEPEADSGTSALEEVIVTGTRIQANGFTAPVPTTILSRSDIETVALPNIADVVNQLPQLQGSGTTTTGNNVAPGGLTGQNILSLRQLGTDNGKSTLVLMDGVRVVPTGPFGTTDVNLIPSQLIQRVDVVTGGASAVYGSDAVAGVVNFILDKNFTGLKGDISGGESTHSDDPNYHANLTFGTEVGSRGHFLLSASYDYMGGIPDVDRSWYHNIHEIPNPAYVSQAATPNVPALLITPNTYFFPGAPGGMVLSGPFAGTAFGPGGTPYPYTNLGGPHGSYVLGPPGQGWPNGQFFDQGEQSALATQLITETVFSRFSYEFTDSLSAFAQVNYGKSHSEEPNAPDQMTAPATFSASNPFLPASLAAMLAPGQTFKFYSLTADLGQTEQNNSRETVQATVGLDGALGGSWKWKAYYQYGRADISQSLDNVYDVANFNAAINVIKGPSGTPVCASAATNPTCVPLNLFGTGVASPAALAYVMGDTLQRQTYTQQVSEATVSGEPFSTWAAPVPVVLGIGWRHEEVSTPYVDPISLQPPTGGWLAGNWTPLFGEYSVKEAFGEIVTPLAKDQPWAHTLDLDVAGRVTDYSTSGTVETWKIGMNYRPIQEILFRASVSQDIRAPDLSEIYGGAAATLAPILDPANGNGSTLVLDRSGVNTALTPEKAHTYGAGVVFQPAWLQGFSTSLDWWSINLKNAISQLTAQTVINDCFSIQAYCQYVTRGPGVINGSTPVPNAITGVETPSVNLNSATAKGIDFELDYHKALQDWISNWRGTVAIRALGTYNISNTQTNAGVFHQFAGELSDGVPKQKWNVTGSYLLDGWTLSATWRYISAGVLETSFFDTSAGPLTVNDNDVPHVSYFDLGLSYMLPHEIEIYGRVENLFDKAPPVVPSTSYYSQQTNPQIYDVIGRYFRAGLRFKF